MSRDGLYSLRAVADALGLPARRVRSWADHGTLLTAQSGRGAERLVPGDELERLEDQGFRVNWEALEMADAADASDAAIAVTDAKERVA